MWDGSSIQKRRMVAHESGNDDNNEGNGAKGNARPVGPWIWDEPAVSTAMDVNFLWGIEIRRADFSGCKGENAECERC